MNAWESSVRATYKPQSKLPPWRWAEEHVEIDKTSPFPGRFRSDTAPWTREPMEMAADNRVRRITVRCAAQTSKTTLMMMMVLYWIMEDPGPLMWVMAAADEAKTFVNTRLRPSLESCKPVALLMPKERKHNKTLEVHFPNAPLSITGANSPSKLQSKPIRYLVCDEVRNYPPGALETVLKRTTSFWNGRELIISTGDTEGDAVDREFVSGDQRHYYVECPHCSQSQVLKFEFLKWDENEDTRPAGEWRWDKVAASVRYECPACKQAIKDSFAIRRKMALSGKWVPHNKSAASDCVSYTWSALIVPWIPWVRIVKEFLNAKGTLDTGVHEPLKTWVTETMGESWKEDAVFGDDIKVTGDFSAADPWPDEKVRFMTVDVQRDHYWVVVRAWSATGESRLVWCGRLQTEGDLKDCQKSNKVNDRCVILDCGYEQNRVFAVCCANGWVALKGEDRQNFSLFVNGVREVRAHSWPPLRGDPGVGTASQGRQACPFFLWSNPTIKDILHRLKTGRGASFGIPGNVDPEYLRHMCSEMKRKERNRKTGQVEYRWVVIGRRQNHMWDCECMQVVAAMIDGVLANPFAQQAEPVEKTSNA